MTTKRLLAELVIMRLSAGNPSFASKLDARDIFAAIDIMIPSLIHAELKGNMKMGSFQINGAWYTAFENVKVYKSKSRKERYINLPARLVSLEADRGIMIFPMEDQSWPFVITNNTSQSVFRNLEAGKITRTCYVEGNKVFFPTLDSRVKEVLVKMVGATDQLDEDDPLPVPAIMEDQLLEKLVAKFKEQVAYKEKKTNDSNVNTI